MNNKSSIGLLILFLFLGSWNNLFSQMNKDKFLDKARTDFAVPDAPAFKILQTDASTALRPTSAREVAVTIANLFKGEKIPDNYSLELSPGLLFSNSLAAYSKNPFWYRARISFAVKSTKNSTKLIGTGLRLTLVDETDLRMDDYLARDIDSLYNKLDSVDMICKATLEKQGVDDMNADVYDSLFNKCREKAFTDLKMDSLKIINLITDLREKAKANNWNAPIVEMGFATSALSGDSLAKSLSVNSYQFWFSAALPLGKEGQIIAGLNGGVSKNDRDELKKSEGSLGVRGYYGTNKQKLFLEADIKAASEMLPSYAFNLGYEYNLMNGVWADISLGLIRKDGSKFVSSSSLNFRFATPE